MPRAIWSGTISFGLVSVPVRMFAAVSEHKLHFNLLHRKDESPIGYEKVCKLEEKPVPDSEIVKAYEIEKGEFVYVEDEDFQAARAEGGHAFDIEQFVPVEDIDPIYFEHSYYLGPQDGAEKVYMLLVKAMEDAGLGRDRDVPDARPRVPRLPADPRRRDHTRAHVLRGRDPAAGGPAAEGRAGEQGGTRDGGVADRPLPGRLRPEAATRTPTPTGSST